MRRILSSMAMACVLASSLTQAATPEDAIKYRKAVMQTMAGHMVAISLIFNGKVDAQSHLPGHAEALAAAGTEIPHLFPAGSDAGKTDALPLAWQEPARFQQAAAASEKAAAQLREAVGTGDRAAIGRAIKATGDACKGCHDRYRRQGAAH